MTQDPWGQPRPGYVVRGEVVQDNEPGVAPAGQAPPVTHFQKVASAARPEQPEQPDQAASQEEDEARAEEEVRAVSSPDAGRGDYWDDDEDAGEDEAAQDLTAGPAEGQATSASAPAAEPEAAPTAPAGEADEPAGQADEPGEQAGPDAHEATLPPVTQPNAFGTTVRPTAASVPTVPIVVAGEPDGSEGRHAAPTAGAELHPGESGTTLALGESGYASLIADTEDLWAQWHRIQYTFVDDPKVSVTAAADVIAQVATRLEAAIGERQRGLRARWDTTATVDTETLRETLRMYRSFLDQLIGPEPS